jgi:hypothetical protein
MLSVSWTPKKLHLLLRSCGRFYYFSIHDERLVFLFNFKVGVMKHESARVHPSTDISKLQ